MSKKITCECPVCELPISESYRDSAGRIFFMCHGCSEPWIEYTLADTGERVSQEHWSEVYS